MLNDESVPASAPGDAGNNADYAAAGAGEGVPGNALDQTDVGFSLGDYIKSPKIQDQRWQGAPMA